MSFLAGLVADAAVVKIDDFATAGEERRDAREIGRVDICPHLWLDAGEAPGIETLGFGRRFVSLAPAVWPSTDRINCGSSHEKKWLSVKERS